MTANTPVPASSSPMPVTWPLGILYADDMLELRELMRCLLALDGHRVETVGDGREALARLTRSSATFNLVISDHHMPGINGLELLWHIRRLPYAGKVVIFSSELSSAVNDAYHRLAVDLILQKPVYPPIFRQQLRQLFGQEHPGAKPPGRWPPASGG